MNDMLASQTAQGLASLYAIMSARIDAVDTPKTMALEMRAIVDELVKLKSSDKVRQAAKQVATEQMGLLRELSSWNAAQARVLSKKHILLLLSTIKNEGGDLAFAAKLPAPPCRPAVVDAAAPAGHAKRGGVPAAQAGPVPRPRLGTADRPASVAGGAFAAPAPAPEPAKGPAAPFEVAAQTVPTFFQEFLGKYVVHLLSTFQVVSPVDPGRVPYLLSPVFAERLGTVLRDRVAPFLLEFRIMKVRLVENFNIHDDGVLRLIEQVADPRDNAIHHVWDIFWQPMPDAATAKRLAASGASQELKRVQVLQGVLSELRTQGYSLEPLDIDVMRNLIRLPLKKVQDELVVARTNLPKEISGEIRQNFIRDRIEKLMIGEWPPYSAELMLLRLISEYPQYFNDHWSKWFEAGFRDKPNAITLMRRWSDDVRAAVGRRPTGAAG